MKVRAAGFLVSLVVVLVGFPGVGAFAQSVDLPAEASYDEQNGVCLTVTINTPKTLCSGPAEAPMDITYDETNGVCITSRDDPTNRLCSGPAEAPGEVTYDEENGVCVTVTVNTPKTLCSGPAEAPGEVTYDEENGVCVTVIVNTPKTLCTGPVPPAVPPSGVETPKTPAFEFELGPSAVLTAADVPSEAMGDPATLSGSVGTPIDPLDPTPVDEQANSQKACTYHTTNFAAGGKGEGDEAFYAVDNRFGAHAAAHAHSGPFFNLGQARNSSAWAAAGWEATYVGGYPVDVTFILPWIHAGQIRTARECIPITGPCTEASGSTSIKLIVKNVTSGSTLHDPQLFSDGQSGDSLRNYANEGKREFSLTFRPNRVYRVAIRVDVFAHTKGELIAPHLQADTLNDWFGSGGDRGAYFKHVKLRMDTPGVEWAHC